LKRLRNCSCQLLNLHGVNDVRQTEKLTAESLALESNSFEKETANEKQKRCKSPITDQIPAELVQEGGNILRSESHKLINYIWNKE
jgi:hypothetical protein